MGSDGSIGEEKLEKLLDRVYHLSELNNRCRKFIKEINRKENRFRRFIRYQKILVDDPQLPFGFLPEGWLGKKAYRLAFKLRIY